MKPSCAMVLAAGLGLRLRPITDNLPKPLVPVAGRTMLDRALDHVDRAGIGEAVVNCHYLADMIVDHLAERAAPRVSISREETLLDTGGGVANALPLLGADPFAVINADIIWTDGPAGALATLASAWRDDTMDALLLLQPVDSATGYDGAGDFIREDDGRLRRRGPDTAAPFVFTGVQILHPRLFADSRATSPGDAFSLNLLYDRAENDGRLYGAVHDGEWFHVGTPAALTEAEAKLNAMGDSPQP